MRKWLYVFTLLFVCVQSHAASTNDLVIEVAAPPANAQLGFGWLQPEKNDNFSFVWINHLEADIWVALDSAPVAEIEIKAVPFYLDYRSQSIGLYVNERFVAEWVCSYRAPWLPDSYTARIPEGVLKSGRNRITLRMGYNAGNNNNQYALAVNSITLRRP
jgi:hypothetical protein